MKKWWWVSVFLLIILLCLGISGCNRNKDNPPTSKGTTDNTSKHPPSHKPKLHNQKEIVSQIYSRSKKGIVVGSPFTLGQSNINDVINKWGKSRQVSNISTGSYASYNKRHFTFGYRQDGLIFDVRSDHPNVQKVTLSRIKSVLGEPDDVRYYKDSAHNQIILVFNVNATYQLKWILPKPTDTKANPKVDHISVTMINQKESVSSMSLDEKIGQMIFAGINGTTVNEKTKSLIDDYKVGGIILYGTNIQTTNQTLSLLNGLKKEAGNHQIQLLLGTDQEGGRVSRLPEEWEKFPSNAVIGKVNNPEFSFHIGNLLGSELKALGFNLDFAPVMDINSNPNNPVIGDRSFGSDSKRVSQLGIETMKGIQNQNVIPVIKHFPGHGDTSIDSHIGLPKVTKDLDQLRRFELVPFGQAVKSGADVVMVAHILLPKIDSANPASFSKRIMTDLLRNDLNFNGVIITDDMTMGAITKNYHIGNAAVKSVNAGSNMILIGHDYNQVVTVINAIKSAVQKGIIPEDKIDDSVKKIISLKKKYDVSDKPVQSVDANAINRSIKETLNRYMH